VGSLIAQRLVSGDLWQLCSPSSLINLPRLHCQHTNCASSSTFQLVPAPTVVHHYLRTLCVACLTPLLGDTGGEGGLGAAEAPCQGIVLWLILDGVILLATWSAGFCLACAPIQSVLLGLSFQGVGPTLWSCSSRRYWLVAYQGLGLPGSRLFACFLPASAGPNAGPLTPDGHGVDSIGTAPPHGVHLLLYHRGSCKVTNRGKGLYSVVQKGKVAGMAMRGEAEAWRDKRGDCKHGSRKGRFRTWRDDWGWSA